MVYIHQDIVRTVRKAYTKVCMQTFYISPLKYMTLYLEDYTKYKNVFSY